jgi:plastocyanin
MHLVSGVSAATHDDAGEVRYHCTVHSTPGQSIGNNMNGRITVNVPPDGAIFADGFE